MATKKPGRPVEYEMRECMFCGRQMRAKIGRGRPRFYHQNCGRALSHWNQFQKRIESIRFTPTKKKTMAGEMWAERNNLKGA